MLLALTLLLLVIGASNSWLQKYAAIRRNINISVVGASLVGLTGTQCAWSADDIQEMASSPVQVISVTSSPQTVNDDARILRKLAKQKEINGVDVDDGSYLSSIKKEQAKQKAQKKSKAQKAKDLCEALGRGC